MSSSSSDSDSDDIDIDRREHSDDDDESADDVQTNDKGELNKEEAEDELRALFHRGPLAYMSKGKAYHRYYCLACLEDEVEQVKLARSEHGQVRNVGDDVLRPIAISRMEFVTGRIDRLLKHLLSECQHAGRRVRRRAALLQRILQPDSSAKRDYRNPYNVGSMYDQASQKYEFPKDNLSDLAPGATSPANLFARHERRLYQLALDRQQLASKHKLRKMSRRTDEGDFDDAHARLDDRDPFEDELELQQEGQKALFSADKWPEIDAQPPEDFPSSDLLKALEEHAATLYDERGLMSTSKKPADARGNPIPSMVQALDGSALVALGILTQELVKHETIRPHNPEPESNLFQRRVLKRSYPYEDHAMSSRQRALADNLLSHLPEGSTLGVKEIQEILAKNAESDRA